MVVTSRALGRFRNALSMPPVRLALLAVVVLVAALLGVLSRPVGLFATFWPANALLAGILVRSGSPRKLPAILAAAVGYLCAGALVGDDPIVLLLMTLANLTGVVTFVFLFSGRSPEERALSVHAGVLALLVAAIVASAAAAVLGSIAISGPSPASYFDAWLGWLAAELVNYLTILPAVLTFPTTRPRAETVQTWLAAVPETAPPIATLVATVYLSLVVSHPMAVAFPIPALIWCALVLPVPVVALLIMIHSTINVLGLTLGRFELFAGDKLTSGGVAMVHLGVAVIALGPIFVASVTADRRRLVAQLKRLAHHDPLTDAMTRSAFEALGGEMFETLRREQGTVAVLLVDADRFKQINDTHGHLSGDRVLVAIAAAIRSSIRQGDLFGRLGGEEFALVLPSVNQREATNVAERVRRSVANLVVVLESGGLQKVTVSVGVAFSGSPVPDLVEMVSLADRAMYDAKNAGRDRVEVRDYSAASLGR